MPLFFTLIYFILFLFGLEFGSFANVCIYRWPLNMSIAYPIRSYCPWCTSQISWYHNIPVVSYIFLKGHCAKCGSTIAMRYPIIELLTSALWTAFGFVVVKSGQTFPIPFLASLLATLFIIVVTTATDIDWKIIPNEATFFLLVIGILFAPWNTFLGGDAIFTRIIHAVAGAAAASIPMWGVSIIGKKILGRDAFGGGDIKLLASFGSILGWQSVLGVLLFAAILGGLIAIIGLLSHLLKRREYIPFGPFLNIACTAEIFFRCSGHSLVDIGRVFFL